MLLYMFDWWAYDSTTYKSMSIVGRASFGSAILMCLAMVWMFFVMLPLAVYLQGVLTWCFVWLSEKTKIPWWGLLPVYLLVDCIVPLRIFYMGMLNWMGIQAMVHAARPDDSRMAYSYFPISTIIPSVFEAPSNPTTMTYTDDNRVIHCPYNPLGAAPALLSYDIGPNTFFNSPNGIVSDNPNIFTQNYLQFEATPIICVCLWVMVILLTIINFYIYEPEWSSVMRPRLYAKLCSFMRGRKAVKP